MKSVGCGNTLMSRSWLSTVIREVTLVVCVLRVESGNLPSCCPDVWMSLLLVGPVGPVAPVAPAPS